MEKTNEKSKDAAYSSKLEKYMNEQEDSSTNLNDDDFEFQTSKVKSSKLDQYLGIDDDKNDEEDIEVNYCSICGTELKKFNYGDKCDDCVKKIELVNDINKLLDYVSPSEELKRDFLLSVGFDELKLNIMFSNMLDENLIVLGSNGIFLSDVKSLNSFFQVYGSSFDILDESLYKNVMFADNFVDISKYSDLVQLLFNPKNNKWEVNLYIDNKPALKKFFSGLSDANNFATRYLKEMGELDNISDKKPVQQQVLGKYKRSKHKFIFFSTKRNQWCVKVRGHVGSKIVGFYDTEDEAVIARDEYIKKKRENQAKLKPKRFVKDESDAIISFQEKYGMWVLKVKRRKGGFKKLGYFDTEEDAITAKNEYYGINRESDLKVNSHFNDDDSHAINAEVSNGFDVNSLFNEGDRVLVLSEPYKFYFGVIQGYNEERDSFIVKLENSSVPLPVFIKSDQLKLV